MEGMPAWEREYRQLVGRFKKIEVLSEEYWQLVKERQEVQKKFRPGLKSNNAEEKEEAEKRISVSNLKALLATPARIG